VTGYRHLRAVPENFRNGVEKSVNNEDTNTKQKPSIFIPASDSSKVKRVVLAYSGGLDTSVIVPWLQNNYDGCEVICMCANLGQEDELR
jgi:hypothetical protein